MSRRQRMGGGELRAVGPLSPGKSALLERRLREKGLAVPDRSTTIGLRSGDGPVPLSFNQEGLWFINKVDPERPTYNIPGTVRLEGHLDVGALERSLGEIVRRHEILRTVFGEGEDGVPYQVVTPPGCFRLPLVDLGELPGSEREAEVLRRARENGAALFDLARGPLFGASLLRLGEQEHVLLLRVHHLVCDGWSFGVLTRELSALYGAFKEGRASPLPPLPLQFADFAVWQRERLTGAVYDELVDYWRSRLGERVRVLDLPTDRPRPPTQTVDGMHHPVRFGASLSEELRRFSRGEGVTLFVTMFAAFNVLMRRYTGQSDITIGSTFANRSRREVEPLIGYFVTVLPLRLQLGDDPPFRELLGRAREATLGAATHQDLPLTKLVKELDHDRDPGRNPLFQVVFYVLTPDHNPFVYGFGISSVGESVEMSGLRLTPIETECGIARFDIAILIWDVPEGLRGTVEYRTDLFDAATIAQMMELFEVLLRQVVAQPEGRVDSLIARLEGEARERRDRELEVSKRHVQQKLRNLRGRPRPRSPMIKPDPPKEG